MKVFEDNYFYQVHLLDLSTSSGQNSSVGDPAGPSKRCRSNEGGCDGDWQFLLNSAHHREVGHSLSRLLDLDHPLMGGEDGEA